MGNRCFFIVLAALVFVGCSNELSAPSQKVFSQTDLPSCETAECPEIHVDYIEYPVKKAREDSLNAAVKEFIISALYLDDPKQQSVASTIESAAKGFIDSYYRDHAEFPDLAAAYFAEISVTESHRSESLLSLEMTQYKYVGGAHGNGTTAYANFDASTGKKIPNVDLFSDFEGFTKLAEDHFRKAYTISEEGSINADRFWFDEDRFYVPESVGFAKDSVVLHYNPYEIASYADGPIEVKIALIDAAAFLK